MEKAAVGARSRWLLLEIVAAVFLFAIISGICATLFVQAKEISQDSANLTMAMVQAQRAAEAFKAADGDAVATAALLKGAAEEDVVMLAFGPDWQPAQGEAAYTLTAAMSREGELARAVITVRGETDELYRLDVAHRAGGNP